MNDKTFFPFYDERINRVVGKMQIEFEFKSSFQTTYGCSAIDETSDMQMYKTEKFWLEDIWNGITADLYEVFHKVAVRCLIVELHRCKDLGLLSGKTAEGEYDSYCNLLKDGQYVNTIYQKYPGLSYYLDELEEIQVCFWEDLLGHLVSDWEEIKEYFHIDAKSYISSIRRSGSDFHCKGRSVVIIETDQKKKIIYKPHSIENEIFLQNLLADIYKDLGLKEIFYLELEKKGYGWVEEITWEECGSYDEVVRFYKRVGVLAATAYILGIGDLHYENIIAHGEFPVIIDAETLFQHMEPFYQWTEKTTAFYSVLSSGLFPGGTADLSMAGVTGGDGCISLKKIPVIMYDKTSEICVDYQKVLMPKGKNHVRYQEKVIEWEDYEQEVLEGFQLAYEWFRENKDKVLKEILYSEDKLRSRYVSGGTQFFGMSLFASVHPELMTSIYDRRCYIEKICKDRKLGEQEIEAILRGDIPYFFRKLTDQSIYDDQKIVVCDSFELTIAEKMERRLKELCVEDRILQEKVIAYSNKVFKKECELKKEYGEKTVNDEEIMEFSGVECAKNIADYILENSIRQQDKIFWLGMEEENGTIKIRPVDIYFYSGIAGIAVFFRKLNRICGLYEEVCEKLEKMLFSYTNRVLYKKMDSATEYPGMYCGEGSVLYAYQLLHQITENKKYRDYADKHAAILTRCVDSEAPFDLLYGNAGAVLTLCRQYVDTGNAVYLSEAHNVLDYLDKRRIETKQGITWFEKTEENPVCSIAHGNSGVLLAYARVQSLDHKVDYSDRLKQIIRFEDQFFSYEYGNWADLRKDGEERWKTYAWCNGGMGIAAARAQAAMWNSEMKEVFWDYEKMEKLVNGIVKCREMNLCHGDLGNDIIRNIFLNDKNMKCKLFKRDFGKIDLMLFGLMNGMSGIGIGILFYNTEDRRAF